MKRILLAFLLIPFFSFSQTTRVPEDANCITIHAADNHEIAFEKLITVLLAKNYYLEVINDKRYILHAYKIDDVSSRRFDVQAHIITQNRTLINLTGYITNSNEDGTRYITASNKRGLLNAAFREGFERLNSLAKAYPEGTGISFNKK